MNLEKRKSFRVLAYFNIKAESQELAERLVRKSNLHVFQDNNIKVVLPEVAKSLNTTENNISFMRWCRNQAVNCTGCALKIACDNIHR